MEITQIITLTVSVLTALSVVMTIARDRAGLSATMTKQAQEWIKAQEQRIDTMEARLAELEKSESLWRGYSEYLLAGVRVLIRQICNLSITPEFDPVGFDDWALSRDDAPQREIERKPDLGRYL